VSTKASDREKRRAAALRQNLRRRKTATRKRADSASVPAEDGALETARERPNNAHKPL